MTYSVKTIKWVQNGFTLAYFNNKPLFIHGALPEETIEFEILKENQQHSFGIVKNIIDINPIRKESDCPIFPECGGCSYRHIDYKKEIKLKIDLLKEFKELKPFIEYSNFEYFFSPETSYRNQVRIHSNKKEIGFYKLYSNQIIPFPEVGCKNLPIDLNYYILNNKKIFINKENKLFYINNKVLFNQNLILKINKKIEWELSTDCFLQTNRFLLREWLDWIKNNVFILTQKSKIKVIELFCGTGIISANFIPNLNYIEGFESNNNSLIFAKKNYKKYQIKNKFVYKDLYKEYIKLSNDFDIIIINPPRNGIGKKLLEIFKEISLPILYSSCNPATFNRDIYFLKQYGYRINNLAIFDFFPRTFHLEIVATLVK